MNVLILGGTGNLGPFVVKALEPYHTLRVTDVNPPEDSVHEFRSVDMASMTQVMEAAEGMDAIVNCSVLREHRKIAFDVNTLGSYHMMSAAVAHGIKRVINTGPHAILTGPTYDNIDFMLTEEIPPHSGVDLVGGDNPYSISKSLGQEICKVFTENHDVHVMCLLFCGLKNPEHPRFFPGRDVTPFVVSVRDAAEACRLGLEVDLKDLPSKNEVFYISTDIPHGKFSNAKAKRILGFAPNDKFGVVWHKVEDN